MAMHTKAGVKDKVTFTIKRAPIPPLKTSPLKKLKEKMKQIFFTSTNKDDSGEDDEDDDDVDLDIIRKDPFVGLFFMARK